MDPDEFEAYLETLDPMERQQVMYDFGFQKANFVPPGYEGAYSPELTQQQYDLGQYTGAPVSMDSYGNVDPWSLDVAKDLENWQQDMADLTADPVMAAYGGPGGFDPQAFAPIVTPVGEPVDQPGTRYVNAMAQSGGGYESYLAKKILGGMSPGGAVADMFAKINAGASPEAPPEVQAEREQLLASLPPNTDTDPTLQAPSAQAQAAAFDFTTPEGRNTSTNQGAIFDTANDLFYKMTSDQPIGYTDPKTGLGYAGSIEEPSELAAHFEELGIPTPFEKYTDPEWLGAALPEGYAQQRGQEIEGAQGRIGQAKDVVARTKENMQQLRQGWRDTAENRAEAAKPKPEAPLLSSYLQPGLEGAGLPPAGTPEAWQAGVESPLTHGQQVGEAQDISQGLYDKAYADWEAQNNQGTANPFMLTSGNDVLQTYNFGDLNPQEQGTLGSVLGVIAQGKGYEDVGFNPYDQSYVQDYGGAVQSAADQYSGAQNYYDQVYQQQSPEESNWASSIGRGLAMSDMGRTPMEDALMQRSMGRSVMNPYIYQ